MARQGSRKKRGIETYAHTDKERANNPPVGLVTPETDRDAGKKTYAHDPHLDPQLSWAGKAEHTSFGPDHAPLEQRQVARAVEEAQTLVPAPKIIVFAAFQFDPEAAKDIDETHWPGVQLLKAQMNANLLTGDLKRSRASNESFWLIGQPDVAVEIEAQGTADSLRLIADTQAEARKICGDSLSLVRGELDIKKEIHTRIEFQEEKRRRNIGTVVKMAAEPTNFRNCPDVRWTC